KLVGGYDYAYSMPGDPNAVVRPVEFDGQQRAVDALLRTLSPETLAIDRRIVELLVPPSSSNAWSIESPSGYTAPVFDPLAVAETAASMTIRALLHPARAARLVGQQGKVEQHPGFAIVLDPLGTIAVDALLDSNSDESDRVARRVATVVVNEMIRLASDVSAREDVRAEVRRKLADMADRLERGIAVSSDDSPAEGQWNVDKVTRFLARPDLSVPSTRSREPPPGSPIGSIR
ncbi:MAG: zinc-dependent metalloprotease, partial [Planctomycetota bacterium]